MRYPGTSPAAIGDSRGASDVISRGTDGLGSSFIPVVILFCTMGDWEVGARVELAGGKDPILRYKPTSPKGSLAKGRISLPYLRYFNYTTRIMEAETFETHQTSLVTDCASSSQERRER